MPLSIYSSAPPNFKEITEKEFAQSFMFTWEPTGHERRSVLKQECDRVGVESRHQLAIYMFHHSDGTGVAMSADWHAGKLRFFKFATCEHVYNSGVKLGNCYYEYTCGKCGHKNRVDSGD